MPHKQKKNTEEKVRIVRQYLQGEISITRAAELGDVDRDTIRKWIRIYETEGISGFMYERNKTYSPEIKRLAVEAYLAGEGSQSEICKRYGIRGKITLQSWIKVYNGGGDPGSVKHSGGGSYMKQGRETTQAERIEIAKACIASGKNYGEIALKYQVSYQQARSWTLRFEKEGESGLEDRRGKRKKDQSPRNEPEEAQIRIRQLEHQLYLAEMERDLLKKLDEVERRYASRK